MDTKIKVNASADEELELFGEFEITPNNPLIEHFG